MKTWSIVFAALAVLLSDVMCAVVAYLYRDMLCGIAHDCYSAPAGVAFLYAIPFAAGIIICAVLACVLKKKHKRKTPSAGRSLSFRYPIPNSRLPFSAVRRISSSVSRPRSAASFSAI